MHSCWLGRATRCCRAPPWNAQLSSCSVVVVLLGLRPLHQSRSMGPVLHRRSFLSARWRMRPCSDPGVRLAAAIMAARLKSSAAGLLPHCWHLWVASLNCSCWPASPTRVTWRGLHAAAWASPPMLRNVAWPASYALLGSSFNVMFCSLRKTPSRILEHEPYSDCRSGALSWCLIENINSSGRWSMSVDDVHTQVMARSCSQISSQSMAISYSKYLFPSCL
mmetsp:Transcript_16623/g.41561  ORF Transcript_16623/g.41561 Transcript_16623/m.41561 type:complete len:221 (-) Transcript_16623:1-663(-)